MGKLFLAMGLILFLVVGCSKNETDISYSPSCSGTAKSFKTDVSPLIQSYCQSCHTEYSTYSQISASKNKIRSVVVSGEMPRGKTLTSAQKDAIICWIDNGAQNN